jgi:hypothetical protein
LTEGRANVPNVTRGLDWKIVPALVVL